MPRKSFFPNEQASKQGIVYGAIRKYVLEETTREKREKLPSLRELSEKYHTSVASARLALVRLEREGLINSKNGVGYFINSQRPLQRILFLESGIHDHLFSTFFQAFQAKISAAPSTVLQVESLDSCAQLENANPTPVLKNLKVHFSTGVDACFFDGEKVWGITPEQFRSIQNHCRPFYFMSGYPNFLQTGIPGVSVDWYVAGYVAAHHLLEIGCRNIVCEYARETAFHHGIEDALTVSKYDCKLHLVEHRVPFEQSDALPLFQKRKIDGYIASSDSRVFYVLPILKNCGYNLPDDLAIIGRYNTPWATGNELQLTSLDLHPELQVDYIWKMFKDEIPSLQMTVPPSLIKRCSTLNFKPRRG